MKPIRTSIHIRRDDEEIFLKISHLNFGEFVSYMMNKHGESWIIDQVEEQVKKLNKLTK